MRPAGGSGRRREALGVLLFTLGLLLGAAFIPGAGANPVGPLGADSLRLLSRLFSWGGLVVPILALVWGGALFLGRGYGRAGRFSLVASVGTLACLTAVALLARPASGASGAAGAVDSAGTGLVARELAASLSAAFGPVGGLIVLAAGVMLALVFGIEARPSIPVRRSRLVALAGRTLRALLWTGGLVAAAAVWLVTWVGGLASVLGLAVGAGWARLAGRGRARQADRAGAAPPGLAGAGPGPAGAWSSLGGAASRTQRPGGGPEAAAGDPAGMSRTGPAESWGRSAGGAGRGSGTAVAASSRAASANGSPLAATRAARAVPEPAWEVPLEIFDPPAPRDAAASERELQELGRVLIRKLGDFNVKGEVVRISSGPVITQFEVEPAPGVKVNQIANLADDLALAMRAQRIRIVAPIPGKGAVGIEIPNARPERVTIRELLAAPAFKDFRGTLPIALGKEISGTPVVADLTRMPHLLIAGSTGSGKSVCINALLSSLLVRFSPAELRLILVDPKMLELSMYNDVPHLLHPVVTRAKDAATALKWAVYEMERRFELLARNAVRNVLDFNARLKTGSRLVGVDSKLGTADEPLSPLPYVVVVVDELADLMLTVQAEIEDPLARLAQKARAVGLHVVLATQRPSVNVLTGFIKANFPSRISFQVASKTDSRTILDQNGAEALLGQGDMLFLPADRAVPARIQGAFVSARETEALVEHVKRLAERREFAAGDTIDLQKVEVAEMEDANGDRDELFFDAARVVIEHDQGSTSLLQRRLKVGYSRAARIVDQLHQHGILGPPDGSKPREVRIGLAELEELQAGPRGGGRPAPRPGNPAG